MIQQFMVGQKEQTEISFLSKEFPRQRELKSISGRFIFDLTIFEIIWSDIPREIIMEEGGVF